MKKHANRQAKSQLPLLVVRFKTEVIWLLHAPPDRSNSQSRESRHLVSHSHWWCRLHYRSCQGGQETIICMGSGVVGTSKKTWIKCICHTLASFKMYNLCITDLKINAWCPERSILLTQVYKRVDFNGRNWVPVHHLRLMPLHLTWKDHLYQPVLHVHTVKPSTSAKCPTHPHTVNWLEKSQSGHNFSSLFSLSLSHTYLPIMRTFFPLPNPRTVTLACKLLTQQTLLWCGSFTTSAFAERSALSQPISFQQGAALLWSSH